MPARHLLEARRPEGSSEVVGLDPDAVADAFFNALNQTVSQCLTASLPQHVVELLDAAHRVVMADDSDQANARRRRLERLGWDAYSLLGDEAILDVVLVASAAGRGELGSALLDDVPWTDELAFFSSLPEGDRAPALIAAMEASDRGVAVTARRFAAGPASGRTALSPTPSSAGHPAAVVAGQRDRGPLLTRPLDRVASAPVSQIGLRTADRWLVLVPRAARIRWRRAPLRAP